MWSWFWTSRNRFSLHELRYMTKELQKVQIVNEVNKDFVIEALRSIAELVTYGDQHDPSFFEFFMEKQIMGEFVRILQISRVMSIALQVLQTMSIMIQNLRSEHAIHYIFSNEHIDSLITYPFDFRNEELLSYYISFLRAISGKLNKNTISLLVKIKNDEVVSFPLYTEAIQYAFHEEKMIRIAVRALTLNVYHVGDENVNKYISTVPLSDYYSKLVLYFKKQCLNLDNCSSEFLKIRYPDSPDSTSCILTAVDEIEDNLYYFSDVISSGVPELGRLIMDNILQLLVFPLLLPSLKEQNDSKIATTTSLSLLCCILHIVKSKDLASSIATTFFCLPEHFVPTSEDKLNGCISTNAFDEEHRQQTNSFDIQHGKGIEVLEVQSLNSSMAVSPCSLFQKDKGLQKSLREVLLCYIASGSETEALGSLYLLSTLLQTKELDRSMLDGLGILPQRKPHKKFLLQSLAGEGSGEEQIFFSENGSTKDCINTELERYLQKFKSHHGLFFCCGESRISPQIHKYQVIDALTRLFCRSSVSAEVLWVGGWLLRQLLPHGDAGFNKSHMKILKESHKSTLTELFAEAKGSWCDLLVKVLVDEWRNCKKAIEASSQQKYTSRIFLSSHRYFSEGESSVAAGQRMCEMLKVFVLRHQLLIFSSGGALSDLPPLAPTYSPLNSRAKVAGLDAIALKPGIEIKLDDAVPCKIAFERGKEHHFFFLAVSMGTSGWVLLAEELALRQQFGIVRVAAPLGGSCPKIDDKHPKWLHLRIRPSSLPSLDPSKSNTFGKGKTKSLIDGRWTLNFRDEQMCKIAESMVLEEMRLQCTEVEKRLRYLLDLN